MTPRMEEQLKNRETRTRLCEAFGELAWETQQIFAEKPEQEPRRWTAAEILDYEGSVKV